MQLFCHDFSQFKLKTISNKQYKLASYVPILVSSIFIAECTFREFLHNSQTFHFYHVYCRANLWKFHADNKIYKSRIYISLVCFIVLAQRCWRRSVISMASISSRFRSCISSASRRDVVEQIPVATQKSKPKMFVRYWKNDWPWLCCKSWLSLDTLAIALAKSILLLARLYWEHGRYNCNKYLIIQQRSQPFFNRKRYYFWLLCSSLLRDVFY